MATLAKFSLAWQSVGRLLALTALAIQLAAASIVPSVVISDEPSADFLGFPICHAAYPADDADGNAPKRGPKNQQGPDCALCPFCQAIVHAGGLLVPSTSAPFVPLVVVGQAALSPSCQRFPARAVAAAYPRGPPSLISTENSASPVRKPRVLSLRIRFRLTEWPDVPFSPRAFAVRRPIGTVSGRGARDCRCARFSGYPHLR